MDTETILRISAVLIAGCILLSTVNWVSIMYNVVEWFSKKKVVDTSSEGDFLEIVSLWHELKEKCNKYGLDEAVEKIDEVFPLLNAEADNV